MTTVIASPRSPAPPRLAEAVLALACYAGFFILFFSPVLFGGRVLAPGDGFRFHYPHYQAARALWDPRLGSGFPVAADPQVMTWYPPAMVLALIPASFNAFVLGAYLLASWFTFLYMRCITGSVFPAIISGLIFGTCGFLIGHLAHLSIIHTAAWLPAMLFSLEMLARRRTIPWLAATAVITACCITAGHMQIVLYVLTAAAAYVVVISLRTANAVSFVISGVSAIALGVALAGVHLLPAFELVRESARGQLDPETFASHSLGRRQLVTFVFPYLFGGMGGRVYHVPYFIGTGPAETTCYAGLAALALALVALLVRARLVVARFWAAIGAVSLLLALGAATPLASLLYLVPLFNSTRAPGRFIVLVDFALAVLAGVGADAIVREVTHRRRLLAGVVAAPAALVAGTVMIAASYGWLRSQAAAVGVPDAQFTPWTNGAVLIPWITGLVLAVALWTMIRAPRSFAAQSLLVAVVAADLIAFGFFNGWRSTSPSSALMTMPQEVRDLRDALQRDGGRWLAVSGVDGPPVTLPPDTSTLWGVPSASKYGPLLPLQYRDLLNMQDSGGVAGTWASFDNRAIDLVGVHYAAAPPPDGDPVDRQDEQALADERRWALVRTLDRQRIFENRRALPRVRLVRHAMTLSATQILDAIHTSRLPDGTSYDPEAIALVEEPVTIETAGDPRPANVHIVAAEDTSVDVQADAPWPALLVLSDLYYPGWTATVNGEAAHVFRTNAVQRGVVVRAGVNRVRFAFRPASLRAGAAVSAAAALALAGLVFTSRFRQQAHDGSRS